MADKKGGERNNRGLGAGYVTIIMLFAVICLTVLAVLSYQAALANDKLNEKTAAFTDAYYNADSRAKEKLAKLDEGAFFLHESGFFDDSFVSGVENAASRKTAEGYEVSFSEKISGNLILSVKVVFFDASDEKRYRIDEWKTVTAADEEQGSLNVWDGSGLA